MELTRADIENLKNWAKCIQNHYVWNDTDAKLYLKLTIMIKEIGQHNYSKQKFYKKYPMLNVNNL